MNTLKKRLPAILFVAVLAAASVVECNRSSPTDAALPYEYFEAGQQTWQSGRVTHRIGDIRYTATEIPIQYYLIKNNRDHPEKKDSLYATHATERIVKLEFRHENAKDLLLKDFTGRTYDEAVEYMAFGVKKDFVIITSSKDTVPCSGVHFERNFKLAPFNRVLLYFTGIAPGDRLKLIYQDRLFGNGIMEFNLTETPKKF